MIMMRPIIAVLAALTLTACDVDNTVDRGAAPAREAAATATANGSPAAGSAAPVATPEAGARNVLFVGTSLTAGYGVGDDVAYPAVIQDLINDAGLPFRVVNAGISGETSAGGLRRIDWSLQQPVDVLVLELGANDGLRGLDPEAMRSNLDEIMTRTRARHPGTAIVIAGREAPPNLGQAYTTRFRDVYSELAAKYDAALLPFLLDGVAGEPELNIDDGIHPNAAGHRRVAAQLWTVLEPVLRRRAAQPPSSD
jgi:acyl-CoA thioesterase I